MKYQLLTIYGLFEAETLDKLVQKVLAAMDVWDADAIRAMAKEVHGADSEP